MTAKLRQLVALAAAALLAAPILAQEYPNKPIRIIVSSPAGSAPDIIARVVGDAIGRGLGATVIVDNKPGAGGIIAMSALKTSAPDGYTLSLVQAAVATVTPLTYKAANYDIERAFEPAGIVGMAPMMFTANPKFPVKTLKEAIEAAKAKPGEVSIGNPTRTSIPHLANELLATKAGARFKQIPFSSTPQGIQATLAGDIQIYTDGVAPLIALTKSGKLKPLAVAADVVLPGLEGIPLAKETVPGLVVYGWFMMAMPKGTPGYILQKVNTELNHAIRRPAVVARMRELGTYPLPGSILSAQRFVRSEKALFGDVIKQMGLQPE